MRADAGLNGTSALAFRNTENVGVAPAAVVICAEAASGCRHTPVTGSDGQTSDMTGSVASPVSVETVSVPLDPTLAVATAKAPRACWLNGTLRMPSPVAVAASAMMSGTALAENSRSTVLTPGLVGAGLAASQ